MCLIGGLCHKGKTLALCLYFPQNLNNKQDVTSHWDSVKRRVQTEIPSVYYLLYQIICTHLEPDHGDSWAWLDSPRPLASLNLCRKKYCIWMKCVDKNTWRNQGLMNVYVTRASFKSAEAQQDVSLIISLNDWSVMKCQFSLTSIHFSWLLFGREDYFCPNNQWGVVYTSHMCHFQSTWK